MLLKFMVGELHKKDSMAIGSLYFPCSHAYMCGLLPSANGGVVRHRQATSSHTSSKIAIIVAVEYRVGHHVAQQ